MRACTVTRCEILCVREMKLYIYINITIGHHWLAFLDKVRKKNLGLFLVNDMQTTPSPLKSGQAWFLVQKDAQCPETQENNFPIISF